MKRVFKVLALTMILMLVVTPALAAATFIHVPLSLPDGFNSGILAGIWGSGANNVYAVGWGYDGSADVPMLYHYEGSGWMGTGLALPNGWNGGQLNGVWGSGPSDVYGVGSGYDGDWNLLPLFYYYNGNSWTEASLALPGGWWNGELNSVWGSGPSDIYVVGWGFNGDFVAPLVYHYNGISWAEISPDLPAGWWGGGLNGVWGSGPNDIYAVGWGSTGDFTVPLVYYYDGVGWVEVSPVLPDGWLVGQLNGVWGSGSNDVYAVGSGFDGNWSYLPLIYHYDGYGWTEATPALPDGWNGGGLMGVWGSGPSDVYAVGGGYYGFAGNANIGGGMPLIYYFDGFSWTDDSPDLPDGWTDGGLLGVWGSSMYDVYAAGGNVRSTSLREGADGGMGIPDGVGLPLLYHASPPPQVGLNALSHDFGDQLVGTTSNAFTFIVTNIGGPSLYIDTLGISGEFILTDNQCNGQTLGPGETCSFNVAFSPLSVGGKTGQVTLVTNVGNTIISLSGNGTAPIVSLSETSHDFGYYESGTASAPYNFTVTNIGNGNLIIGTLHTDGEFGLSGDGCSGQTVAPGYHCDFAATFSPLSAGAKAGHVYIPSNAVTSEDVVSLSGNGYVALSETFISSAPQDGHVTERGSTNLGGSASASGGYIQIGDASADRQLKGFLSFDTSQLPANAVIVRARIELHYISLIGNNSPFDWSGPLHVDIARPFGTSDQLRPSDFEAAALVYDVASCDAEPDPSYWYACDVFAGTGFFDLSGFTQFRLYFAVPDNGDARADYVRFASANSRYVTYRPVLLVEYYVP